ncbi:MAG: alpha-amylase family glycosyl hydrolase [Clostridia bacterium]|nr:alpha-amylase family glycosyl hydrolase [Clostridia bacterium]
MKRTLCFLLMVAMLISGCSAPSEPDSIADNYRVFYQIFVGSFSDSNGDGTGDIQGIINRLDYLNDGDVSSGESLGVQGLWLSPIFKSPSYHKYDVTDYYEIDPEFGTEEDLKELIELCHERNVKVILDLPINHTSSNNMWFLQFTNAQKSGDSDDEYYDFYSHCAVDQMQGGHTYNALSGASGIYYECNFSTDMPELNFDNEAVRQAVLDVAAYYLDLGVDGFRFDAIKYVYYGDTAASADFWSWYMGELTALKPDIYCVGECWSNDAETLEYISALNCFNFQMAQAEGFIANAVKGTPMSVFTNYVENYQNSVLEQNLDGMIIPFISNHDMDRASGYLTLATKRMYMAANLYILCSGSPFIYYGEEIGMRGSRGGANTDANRRLAMNWGDGDTIEDPVGTTYDPDKQTNGTVLEQLDDSDSLYNHYCRLIRLRNKYPEIARGDYEALSFSESRVGGFRITYDGSTIGLIHNTADREISVDIGTDFLQICDYIGQGEATLEGTTLTIGPQTSVILK